MILALLVIALLAPTLVAAQPSPGDPSPDAFPASVDEPFVVPRLTGPVDLDGRVDEAAWEAVAPLPLVTHWPIGEAASASRLT